MGVRTIVFGVAVAVLAALAGCGPSKDKTDPLTSRELKTTGDPETSPREKFGSVTGDSLSNLFGGGEAGEGRGGGGIGVNAYLWRASLDTVSFMPLASADPFGGVIITDWYSPPEAPDERFKVNLYILGRQLRADGLRASVFRQQRTASGEWADAPVEERTASDLENAILARARQMRIASIR